MTPACLALDAAGIDYELHPYTHDPAASSYGEEAAVALGVEADRVFKTLMAELDDGELVVAIVPVTCLLDLKSLAQVMGSKKAAMTAVQLAERSSGYVAGGISPFGQRTRRRTAIDEMAMVYDTIFVSGGRRGLDLAIAPDALVSLLDAVVAELT
jgi:Cys-tRNA(Pro)/Cys-tRNA(Cys) deacylase